MEDINQHFEQLRRLLVKLGYPHAIDKERICTGITTELLPLLHFGLLSHSKLLASFILDSGYDLYQKNDLRFTEGIYKLMRNEFKYNPVLQCSQFLTEKGFTKRKIQFVVECLKLGISKHNVLIKKKKLQTQSKISWNETNLAKKMTKIIKKNHQNKAGTNVIKKAPKIIKKKVKIKAPRQIIVDPITEHEDAVLMNDSLTADEIRCDLPQPIAIQNKEESEDEHKDDEREEKAMEISKDKEEDVNEAEQSMQIPQHQYDMNLIPEYDPSKYITQCEEDKDDNRSNGHYSATYLDTYSALMDIPSQFLNTETGQNDNSEHKQQGNISSQVVVMGSNIGMNDEEDDDDDDEEDVSDDDEQQKQSENQENQENQDGNDDDEDDNGNNDVNDLNTVMKVIMDRLDKMENKMSKQFETIDARLTILEGKIKFVESKQEHNDNVSDNNRSNGKSTVSSLISTTANKSIQSKTTLSVCSEHKEKEYDHHTFTSSTIGSSSLPISLTPAPHKNIMGNYKNIMSKTVPRTSMTSHLNSNIMPISSTIGNRYISSTTQQPKHIHLSTARSPFIGDMNVASFGGMMKSPYGSTQSHSSLYQPMIGNMQTDMMRYPLSNSQSNGSSGVMSIATNNGSVYVPKIQSVQLSSASNGNNSNQNSSNNQDSTMNFINELKEMLRSTDELLKSKPITLYDSHM